MTHSRRHRRETEPNIYRRRRRRSPTPEPLPKRRRRSVPCYCSKCAGALVNPITEAAHADKPRYDPRTLASTQLSLDDAAELDVQIEEETPLEYSFLPNTRRKRKHKFTEVVEILSEEDSSDDNAAYHVSEDDDEDEDEDERDEDGEPSGEAVESFDAPEFSDDETFKDPPVDFEDPCLRVVLLILGFQARFRLSKVATDALVKLIREILCEADESRYGNFPTSLHVAKKLAGISQRFKRLAACPGCHKLYTETDVKSYTERNRAAIKKCDHVEFPTHRQESQRRPCGTNLAIQSKLLSGTVIKPRLIFPLGIIKYQLHRLLSRPGFEEKLRKWTNRDVPNGVLSDMLDGRVFREFKLNPDDPSPFFTPEHATDRLPLMINLDWFQPYLGSPYSLGAIYGVICTLPREDRFQPENILLLGLLPGPQEVGLHQINHYLAPIVDQLLELGGG